MSLRMESGEQKSSGMSENGGGGGMWKRRGDACTKIRESSVKVAGQPKLIYYSILLF